VIFLQGDRSLLDREIVTIVGSRRSTEYGRRVAREVATAASRSGAVVASGLAVGIDGEAHGAALEAGGKTLAVTGSGLRRPYPRCHTRLFRRIAREGLLVSEFMPEEPPLGRHFLQRNRTLAALANVVVVVEAARESGALNTVGHAMELGREVLTVPGPIYARTSEGTNGLLGAATALVRPTDLVDYLSAGRPHALSLFPDAPPDDVGADALRIWDALAETSRHVDELAHEAHLAPGPALVALSQLELGGWVRQEAGGRFARGPGVS
jgi:DNA processing protein